ncbi:hypothetical protein B0H15DRAFT_53248 [Mycena belliarum]|uniref:Uncharacterized protein n=1 Tax=Mycena belliarum TaxID=1033014 RepID=A0AAD6UFD5_9AGAR|nr:hypothetical protein B0H15DRAFT_53248 [Mycena belliae]
MHPSSTSAHATGSAGFIDPTVGPDSSGISSTGQLVSKGEIAGIVIGVLIIVGILGATSIHLWRRQRAPLVVGYPANFLDAPLVPKSKSGPSKSSAPHLQANHNRISNPNAKANNLYNSDTTPPPTPSSVKQREPTYYGGGKYALSWEPPVLPQEPTRPPLNLGPQPYPGEREVDGGPILPTMLPPSYDSEWNH